MAANLRSHNRLKDWSYKLNRKVVELGVKVALSTKFREGLIRIINTDRVPYSSYSAIHSVFEEKGWIETGHGVYLQHWDEISENLHSATKWRFPYMQPIKLDESTVYKLMNHKYVYLTPESLDYLRWNLMRKKRRSRIYNVTDDGVRTLMPRVEQLEA